jgi:hypothetical protein
MNDLTPIPQATEWDWYLKARDAVESGQKLPPISEDKPETGYYRTRPHKNLSWDAIGVWRDWSNGGELVVQLNGDDMPEGWIFDCANASSVMTRWMAASKSPISFDAYVSRVETGRWPEDIGGDETTSGIGHNSTTAETTLSEFDQLSENIKSLAGDATRWLKSIADKKADQSQAEKAESFRASLRKHLKSAESWKKTEKAPILEAGRAVDDRFNDLADAIDEAMKPLSRLVEDHLKAEKARIAAERKAAEDEARKKEEAAKTAFVEAVVNGDPLPDAPLPVETLPVAKKPIRASIGGHTGRKTTLREVTVAVFEEDGGYEKALLFFKENPLVRELIQSLADKVVKVGGTVPGAKAEKKDRL